ncbi:MAG TPA: PEP/pyruvate-binding domain-containing protein [Chitinophagaceae bacterium]|nr:PEP/pyruvate-binding domain-containing protein [Chitinophagaceae bacterium]
MVCVPTISRAKISHLQKLSNQHEFTSFQGSPLDHIFAQVYSIKVVLDIHRDQLYFINSNAYRLHFEFCRDILFFPNDLAEFNEYNYKTNSHRSYFIGTVNYIADLQTYALELFAGSEYTKEELHRFLTKIKAQSYFGDSLKLYVNNPFLIKLNKDLQWPEVTPDEIYQHQQIQILQEGKAYGYLRFRDELQKHSHDDLSNAILVLKGTPLVIPECNGILSNEFQTPLSHIQVLTHHRNIPSAIDRQLWNNPTWKKLDNKAVELVIHTNGIEIREISAEEAARLIPKKIPPPLQKLTFDTSIHAIIPSNVKSYWRPSSVGSKASHFQDLYRLGRRLYSPFKTPESAFAIPFYFYAQHIQQAGIQPELELLLRQPDMADSILKIVLKRIRKKIKQCEINPQLLNEIQTYLAKQEEHHISFRFRSSCNAEDLKNFSGAGLYTSETGKLHDSIQSIENAIKKVWASVFSVAAYKERRLFHMDEGSVMMGILVHRNFPNEQLNGVAISKNIYRKDYPGFVVNVQKGDVRVVTPPAGVECEQLVLVDNYIYTSDEQDIDSKYIRFSSLHPGASLMTSKQKRQLWEAIDMIRNYYINRFLYIDIEFKFDEMGQLYVKQVRPYQ